MITAAAEEEIGGAGGPWGAAAMTHAQVRPGRRAGLA